jgi:hypothetical protein
MKRLVYICGAFVAMSLTPPSGGRRRPLGTARRRIPDPPTRPVASLHIFHSVLLGPQHFRWPLLPKILIGSVLALFALPADPSVLFSPHLYVCQCHPLVALAPVTALRNVNHPFTHTRTHLAQ